MCLFTLHFCLFSLTMSWGFSARSAVPGLQKLCCLNTVGSLTRWGGGLHLMFALMDGCVLTSSSFSSVHAIGVCCTCKHERGRTQTHLRVCVCARCVRSSLKLGWRTSGGVPLLGASCTNVSGSTEEREDHTDLAAHCKKNPFLAAEIIMIISLCKYTHVLGFKIRKKKKRLWYEKFHFFKMILNYHLQVLPDPGNVFLHVINLWPFLKGSMCGIMSLLQCCVACSHNSILSEPPLSKQGCQFSYYWSVMCRDG